MSKVRMIIALYSLGNGGGEKALVNMLNSLPTDKYEVDLQLFENKGINLQYVPIWVNVLPALFPNGMLSSKDQVKHLLLRRKPMVALKKIGETILNRNRNDREKTYHVWKSLKHLCRENTIEYDVVISGMHGLSTYYAVDCLKGKRRIAWVHTDYSKIPRVDEDLEYFRKIDAVITVSEHCRSTLQEAFPTLNNIIVLPNLNCPEIIYQMSEELTKEQCFPDSFSYHIVSVGRLIPLKGFDMAIEAIELLKKKGINFKWYFLGEGPEKENLQNQAAQLGCSENVEFLGAMSNPYPYIKNADVIVQSSRYEGKSMVLDEAKILSTPIVATCYDSVKDQIIHEVNGIVVEMNANGIANGVERLLLDSNTRSSIIEYLKNEDKDQESLIERYNSVFVG
jgi:glycosyltransferase involved in cell wall biosynthesis